MPKATPIIAQLRQAVADYMESEGCSCCRDERRHQEHTARLAKLLRVQKYADSSGYDFARHRTSTKALAAIKRQGRR